MRPFADSVVAYHQAGWPCILPVPPETKSPPPVGYTGADGLDTDPMTLVTWSTTHADSSVALRLPDGVIGIDVDHYDKAVTLPDGTIKVTEKRGNDSLQGYIARWGELPATWSSTARGTGAEAGPSRIMFYRCPPGRYVTKLGESIEIIQRHHRYAAVAPSPNPDAGGAPYLWYSPDFGPSPDVPMVGELPWLPMAWVEGLREGATQAGPAAADYGSGQSFLNLLMRDQREECADVASARRQGLAELAGAESGSRHDIATGRVHHLIQLGASGHPGAGSAVLELRGVWETLTASEGRVGEYDRMVLTSARKAVTAVGAAPVDRDPCLFAGGEMWTAPQPTIAPSSSNELIEVTAPEPPRWWSPREVIGAHEFDPKADLDQTLSEAVLQRTYPVLRYAIDTGAWLLRGPDRWDSRGDLTRWAVHELASLMPRGDAEADKGSDERRRAERRKRLMNTAGRNAVGASMAAAVAAGTHPCSLELGRLDAEPHILWAGGQAYDLAACAETLTLAGYDPGTPHLQSAAVAPADVPTPHWDLFLKAVWPDPDIRAWALRVLSITLTGEPDAALPILQGDERRGKSQVVVLLMSVLGTYAIAADPRLLASADNSHASIVYALMGRRLAFVDEGPREGRWAQERLKQLTGGTPLTGNRMRENPVTFSPSHTLVLTSNPEPVLTDPAVKARVRLIPCEGDEAEVRSTRMAIGNLTGPIWRSEAPGVLASMMREAGRWLADRNSALTLAAPASVRERADLIASEQDPIRTWVEESTERYEEGTPAGELFVAFVQWCRERNTHSAAIPTMTAWGRALNKLGYPAAHTRTGRVRPLRARRFDGWAPVVPQPRVTGTGLDVNGRDGSASATSHGENTRSEAKSDGHVMGVMGLVSTSTTTSSSSKNKNIGVIGRLPQTAHTEPQKTDVLPGQEGRDGFEPTRNNQAPKPRKQASPEKQAEKAKQAQETRSAKIADAAGEAIPLPAAVNRAGEITPIPLERAAVVVGVAAARTGAMTVDVETSGYPVGHADYRLRTVQLGGPDLVVVFDATDAAQAELVRQLLAEATKLHAHSATADVIPLVHAGLADESIWGRMHDTVIPAKLADPAETDNEDGLKRLAPAVLGAQAVIPAADAARDALFKAGKWLKDTKADTPLERSGWAQVDSGCATMIRYAGSDVLDTAAIAAKLPTVAPALLERERAVQRITARVSHRGLPIDRERVLRLTDEHTKAREIAGVRVRAFAIDNPGSDAQVANALTTLGVRLPYTAPSSKFPNGQPSVAAAALQPLKGTPGAAGELVEAVLEYRHHDTVLGTFLGPYRELCLRGDGRVRPTIYSLGTDTGRMSCVRPNLQQLPREGGVRACITADPGHVLISADFSGVEVRVMAALSQDPNLIRMLAEGADLHAIVAAQAFGPDWTKSDRYTSKRGVFGWAYGGSVPSLARQIGVSESIMAAVVDSLRLVAPAYVQWADEVKRAVRRGAVQMPTYSGRIIHLTKQFPHKAPNYCIQGTARELLVDAALKWEQTQWGNSILLPIHDEIIAMVPEAQAQEATATLVECMTTELYGVPIKAEPSAPSFAWQDAV